MNCEGKVVDVNHFFGYFVLNDGAEVNTKVHCSILLSQNPLQGLPVVGSRVVIKNSHKHRSGPTFVVCNTSCLQGNYDIKINSDVFINFVGTHKLGAADLIKVDEIMKMLNNFTDISDELKQKLTVLILNKMLSLAMNVERDQCQCLSKRISHFNLITVSACQTVDLKSEKYANFPHWSFGIHSKKNKTMLLFGYLKLQPTYGFFLLIDSYYNLPCIILNKSKKDSISLINCYVLIKNYKVCSEIFSENVPNLEYLVVEFDDIIIIESINDCSNIFMNSNISVHHYKENMCFNLIKKSTICIGNSNKPECWLQVSVVDDDQINFRSAFLMLPLKYISTTIFFEEKRRYKLYFNVPLRETVNTELSRLESCKIYELIDSDACFQSIEVETHIPDKILSIEECLKHISNSSGFVSFQGILKQKKFANSLSSRTRKKSTLYGFGNPGSKVHQLVFSSGELFLDCYLNNWENNLMPLGLIPQMRVIVRNVLPQSRKYVKSSTFTSFEIVSYEPLIDFQTVNLFENDEIDWGPRSFLGHGHGIPFGVIIWGRVLDIEIISVKLNYNCQQCNSLFDTPDRCSKCNQIEKKTNFLLTMYVSDEFGSSKVLVKDVGFLKYILDLQENQFQIWRRSFLELDYYSFNIFENQEVHNNIVNDKDIFREVLTTYLMKFNKCAITSLDLKCRKINSTSSTNSSKPVWFYIDARKN